MSQLNPRSPLRLSYGPDQLHFGELWLPDRAGPHPLAILVHGGFWLNAYDLGLMTPMARAFLDAGTAAWNIEYRRIGDAGGGYPGTFLDNALAVDHVRQLAPVHNLDLTRVIVIGHSAGGHLALWLAARGKIPQGDLLYSDNPLAPRATVSLAGVADLRQAWEMNLGGGAVEKLLGGSFEEMVARLASTSPAAMLPLGVRQILIHGTADDRVPFQVSERYVSLAASRGDDATLIALPDAGHFEVIDPGSQEWHVIMDKVTHELCMGCTIRRPFPTSL